MSRAVADELGVTRTQLALAWVLRKGQVSSAITGARTPEQLQESLGAVEVELTPEITRKIDAIFPPGPDCYA